MISETPMSISLLVGWSCCWRGYGIDHGWDEAGGCLAPSLSSSLDVDQPDEWAMTE